MLISNDKYYFYILLISYENNFDIYAYFLHNYEKEENLFVTNGSRV